MIPLTGRQRFFSWPARIFWFYYTGFRQMTLGKTLWKVMIIKLIIMFGVLKLFFFPDFLATNFDTDRQRADYVLEQVTQSTPVRQSVIKKHEGDQL
ncbi:MAG: DUF4492 domain-containing protein [Desulfobulbus propionicus]|nr:MAG: DUF4492 domain-containing protein [Desulfobulbus propionicus]